MHDAPKLLTFNLALRTNAAQTNRWFQSSLRDVNHTNFFPALKRRAKFTPTLRVKNYERKWYQSKAVVSDALCQRSKGTASDLAK
jgi:hypothetical protein